LIRNLTLSSSLVIASFECNAIYSFSFLAKALIILFAIASVFPQPVGAINNILLPLLIK
jgi:hypothetical protein